MREASGRSPREASVWSSRNVWLFSPSQLGQDERIPFFFFPFWLDIRTTVEAIATSVYRNILVSHGSISILELGWDRWQTTLKTTKKYMELYDKKKQVFFSIEIQKGWEFLNQVCYHSNRIGLLQISFFPVRLVSNLNDLVAKWLSSIHIQQQP